MPVPYPLAAETFGREEIDAAKEVLDSGRLTMGERVREFEADFAAWTGAPHALMTNSGSSANLLAVDAMLRRSDREAPWRPGDEVLVPGLSWPTTVWPLVQLGLVPVFVDVNPTTLAIDLDSAASALTPSVKGMLLIHPLGRVPDMAPYLGFCEEHGLALLEDTCESLGGHSHGRHAGTLGVTGTFSCYFSHHISTIEGGVVITSDSALYDDLLSARAHGWIRNRSDRAQWAERHPELDSRFMFIMAGYNVRPTEIQGAVGRVQLRKLDRMLEAREALARRVQRWLEKSAPWLDLIGAECLPPEGTPVERRGRVHSWMTMPLRVRQDAPIGAGRLQQHLEAQGVETRPIIAGNLARHPAAARLKTRHADSLQECDSLLQRGFMIGCHPVFSAGALDTLERAIASLSSL
jgi:CDP-6-deoxy-D-xylo-4-hexulose-3-dehydrase